MNLSYGFVTSFIGEATKRLLPFTQIIHTDIIVQNVNMNTMNNEYVIINKTEILKRIEELEEEYKSEPTYQLIAYGDKLIKEIMILRQILFQSTPLIPVVEKAYDAGGAYTLGSHKEFTQTHPNRQDYITNLKLDI